ncbi:MAG: response regulator receiver domain [Hyphomonadaceae bacterium]|nr:response regulator receiver domain [Aquidulcibacter sp.]
MVEATSFEDLVREAFLAPVRSVLIVDDEYPTWEEVLNDRLPEADKNMGLAARSAAKAGKGNSKELLDIISGFRDCDPGLVIDFHDPTPIVVPEETGTALELASHLHQSDLLILDYNLEGDAGGLGGTAARRILKSVLSNRHFNLVVVHTGEEDLEAVKEDCLLSLHNECLQDFPAEFLELVDKFETNELDNFFDATEEKLTDFVKYFSTSDYLEIQKARRAGKSIKEICKDDKGAFDKVTAWWKLIAGEGAEYQATKAFFKCCVLKKFEQAKKQLFSDHAFDDVTWSTGGDKIWLRSAKGFVAFVPKKTDDLLDHLVRALEDWGPTPSRLLASKMRYELNSTGVIFEDAVFKEAEVFARFYEDICQSPSEILFETQVENQQRLKIREHISLHTESMSYLVEDQMVEFAKQIIAVDRTTSGDFKAHYNVNLTSEEARKQANAKYNAYISNLPDKATPTQLDSGHVFRHNGAFWVCATPACDLQPGQTSIAFDGASNELRPFTALRLEEIELAHLEASHINSNTVCFIRHSGTGKPLALGLRNVRDEAAEEAPRVDPSTQKVTWRIFIARKGGVIEDGKLSIRSFSLEGDQVKSVDVDVVVHAKLRYEYALNFIQRVGGSVSRIGLGYVS